MDWPFTGRRAELDLVAGLLTADAALAGLAVVGGSGFGKTGLVRQAAKLAAGRAWTVHMVTGTTAGQRVPLGAFAGWLDRLDEQPVNLVSAVIGAVRDAGNGPVLVIVDDAHLLDDLSAFVVHQLVARRSAVDHVRVIATMRSGGVTPDTITALWKDGHLRRLELEPLTLTDFGSLVRAAVNGPVHPAAVERLWELTRGNVLFLHQLVHQELEAGRLVCDADGSWCWNGPITVSPSLGDLVQADIGSASQEVLDVIDLITLAEPLDLVHLLALADPDAIEEAERRGLVSVSHDEPIPRARVGYPLYAETRRAVMGRMRAMRLRGRIAESISARPLGASTVDPVQLGLLWLESDLPPDTELMYQSATEAFRRLDIPLAQRLTEAAIRVGANIEVYVLQARLLALLGRPAEAVETLNRLPPGETTDALWAAATSMRAITVLLADAHPEQSWAVIDEALAGAPASAVDALRAVRALQLAMAARPEEVVALAESIERDALDIGAMINLNFGESMALGDLGRPALATQGPEDAIVLAAQPPVSAYQAISLAIVHVDLLVTNGCIAQARSVGERLDPRWADLPDAPHLIGTGLAGMVALGSGDLPTSCTLLRSVLGRPELRESRLGHTYLGLNYWLGVALTEALARCGLTEAAVSAMEDMLRDRHPAFGFLEPNRLLAQAWVAAARGRSTAALDLVAEAAEYARSHGQHAREVLALQTAIQFGDISSAHRLAELAQTVQAPRAGLAARWAAAKAAGDGWALLSVSDGLEAIGDRIAAADAAAHAAGIFEAANLRGARLTASTRAARLVGECGATTPASTHAATPLPLTRREREVAALVREGLSNKQIAETLTMSVRTVEGHVYRACAKLGLESRTELAALMS